MLVYRGGKKEGKFWMEFLQYVWTAWTCNIFLSVRCNRMASRMASRISGSIRTLEVAGFDFDDGMALSWYLCVGNELYNGFRS